LILAFWKYAEKHYRHPDNAPTSELRDYRYSLRALRKLYGESAAESFSPLKLKAVRQSMIDANLSRGVINQRVGRSVRLFKWAVSEELVPETVYRALATVPGLQRRRSEARETAPVTPVPARDVEGVLPHVMPPVAAMIRLQLLTGMRPGEVCQMRACDLDTSGEVWLYRPASHKTQHRGKARVVALGPCAQGVLLPFLPLRCPHCGACGRAAALLWRSVRCGPCHDRAVEGVELPPASGPFVRPEGAFLFSPREALSVLRAGHRSRRRTKVQPSQQSRRKRSPRRAPGEGYQVASYGYAVRRACVEAGVAPAAPMTKQSEKPSSTSAFVAAGRSEPLVACCPPCC
jgi:integrase